MILPHFGFASETHPDISALLRTLAQKCKKYPKYQTVQEERQLREFRLCVGSDCLGARLRHIAIRPDPYCMLCSLCEPMDRNRLGQCTALLNL